MTKTIIVRYGELALKSERVRRRFERCLIKNMKLALKGIDHKITSERGRIFVTTGKVDPAVKRLIHVPGIVSVSPAVKVSSKMGSITSAAVKAAKKTLAPKKTFAIRTRRVGEHKFSSQDVNVAIGSAVLKAVPGASVDLSAPNQEISIEIRDKNAYVFTDTLTGVGGLPVGSQGNVVALLSGGIDSPVAAYLMMKRGCIVSLLYFDNRPYTDDKTRERAIAVGKKLADFGPNTELRIVQFGRVLRAFIAKSPPKLTCVLCKRTMLKIGEKIANQVKAEALVTGESLGQVASQTLTNLRAIDEAVELPVMRPLIGMDKVEIERIARQIGTFEISTRQVGSCSAVPRYPETYARLEEVIKVEKRLKVSTLIKSALSKIEVIRLS
jgi:thiamine biosynthesis protein ThiI